MSKKEFNKKCRCHDTQSMAERIGISAQDFVRASTGYKIGRDEWKELKRKITQSASRLAPGQAGRYSNLFI